jgi:hypothetical protein
MLARARRAPRFGRLDAPERLVVANLATRRLARRLGLDAPAPELLGEGLAPALQVRFPRIEALPVPALRTHTQVDVRMGLVIVQHHDPAVIAEFGLRELACRALHGQGVHTARHREHDVERLAPVARLADVRATVLPLPEQVAQRLLSFADVAAVVLERQPAALGDVAEVRGNGCHAPPSSRDLDHDLRGTPEDGRPDAVADGRCARPDAGSQARLARGDDPVAWIEQALAPLD